MRFLLVAILLLLMKNSFADSFTTTIHSIDYGKGDESHMVRFDNGRVTFIRKDKTDLLTEIQWNYENQEDVSVNIDKNNFLVSAVSRLIQSLRNRSEGATDQPPYSPSVVKNTNAALKIFKNMRRDYRSTGQCYNRAHIWAYEEYKRSGLNSMKIFMFFTERYIRKYKYHWWFHVTPTVYVGNTKSPRTLDRRYTSGPRQTKTWSDTFIKSKRTCPVVKKFDAFWLNQNKQDCYHIYTSMYYLIPRDIEKRDLTGEEKVGFVEKEIKRAYKDAFRR